MLFTISTVVAIGSFFYSSEIMELLYPIHGQESLLEYTLRINQSAGIYGILMFGLVAMAINYVFGTLLTANGNLKALNIFAGIAVVLSLVINLVLVPRIQATGSAYASLSANGFLCIAQVIFAIYIFKIKANWRYLSALILFVTGIVVAGYFSKQISSNWILNFGIWGGTAILLSFVLRLLNIREFLNILKTE
jgi:O-antigen/teichoic acid export membrane protein